MAQFPVNSHRFDPYKNFKFRVRWDGRYVAGVSRVSALRKITEVIEHRDGSDPNRRRRSPGATAYEPIVLERGVTHDLEFEAWANLVAGLDTPIALKDFRKDITIELLNEAGQVAKAYHVFRCWVSEYQALPDLDANSNEVAIESITLQHEGWARDEAVAEPVEGAGS